MTIIADKPWFSSIPMRCSGCENNFTGWMITGCTLSMAAAYMRAMTCPHCHCTADCLFIGTTPPGEQP